MERERKAACLDCVFCVWKYDMYLCIHDNMPVPVTSDSYCDLFKLLSR